MKKHLVVFVRAPQIGAVKSRLARDIGALSAWKFYRDTTRSLLQWARDDRAWQSWLAVTPQGFVDSPAWPREILRIDQGRGDLGSRMARPFVQLPPGPMVLVGSDIPDLRRAHIVRAFAALDRADVVFGPAQDGGFWLVGMRRRPRPPRQLVKKMFDGVHWSTSHALADVTENLAGQASVALTDMLDDVDTAVDLMRWRARRPTNLIGRSG